MGVMLGAPLLTIATARLNKKRLLVTLLGLAFLANLLSAASNSLGTLVLTRFLSGLPQGIYFGAASVVATRLVGPARAGWAVSLVFFGISVATILGAPVGTAIGQQADWRTAYASIGLLGLVSAGALACAVPSRDDLRGGEVRHELRSLKSVDVWIMVAFGSFAVASLFAIYTFIDPLVTQVAHLPATWTPVAQTVIGFGIALGALWGGGLADRYRFRALVLCLLGAIAAMALLYLLAYSRAGLLVCLFAASFLLNAAVPSITVQMMRLAPQAPTMMGALNMAAFNIANALGAVGGAKVLALGWNLRSPILAGLGLTCMALLILVAAFRRLTRN